MTELWRDIPDLEGLYQASDYGRLRSLDRQFPVHGKSGPYQRVLRGRQVPGWTCESGHLRVGLTLADGSPVQRYVHHLILETFVGPCPPGRECRHLDDRPANNRLTNLSWGTRHENAADAGRNGRTRGRAIPWRDERVAALRSQGLSVRETARALEVSPMTVSRSLARARSQTSD